jgi:hypothetical protein
MCEHGLPNQFSWTGLEAILFTRIWHTTHQQDLPVMPGCVNFRQLFSTPWYRLLVNDNVFLSPCHLTVHPSSIPPEQVVLQAVKSHYNSEMLHRMVAECNIGVRVQKFPSATKRRGSLIKDTFMDGITRDHPDLTVQECFKTLLSKPSQVQTTPTYLHF